MSVIRPPSAAIQQEHHNLEAAFKRGDVRWRPSFPIRLPDVGAVVDEQLDHFGVAQQTRVRQQRLSV